MTAVQLAFDFSAPRVAAAPDAARRLRGRMAQLTGEAAEYSVAADYERRGYRVLHRRWRGMSGEIDLVLKGGAGLTFVEVKQSRDFDRAAASLSRRQLKRIYQAADEFAGQQPNGSLTDMQLDVALLDGHGQMRILENVCALD